MQSAKAPLYLLNLFNNIISAKTYPELNDTCKKDEPSDWEEHE